ncbi:MAG: hypothetical protein HGA45_05730 [Chloroflexales bacterium]|nr:hypothetical protein [Chloroflexales bacterium]
MLAPAHPSGVVWLQARVARMLSSSRSNQSSQIVASAPAPTPFLALPRRGRAAHNAERQASYAARRRTPTALRCTAYTVAVEFTAQAAAAGIGGANIAMPYAGAFRGAPDH